MELLLNVFLFFMLVSLFNMIRYMFTIRKVIRMNKDNPKVKGISIVNGEVNVIEDEAFPPIIQAEEKELVVDPICGKEVERKEAYRILKDDKEYFFCCWDCREKFLENTK